MIHPFNTVLESEYVIHGVILIDCWDYSGDDSGHSDQKKQNFDEFYQQLISHINSMGIKYIIDSSSYHSNTKIDRNIHNNLVEHYINFSADNWDKCMIVLSDLQQQGFTNWYVVGNSWQNCVHANDIGLRNLSRNYIDLAQYGPYGWFQPDIHCPPDGVFFFADDYSFIKDTNSGQLLTATHSEFDQDSLDWKFDACRNFYKLI